MHRYDTDVFVAGGGPAGLAAAIAAAQAGFGVMLADCACPPIDKACGEGIMPEGVAALAQLGVALSPDVAAPLHGIKFVDAAGFVEARFARGNGYGVRRTLLHQLLLDRACAVGVKLRWGARVNGLAGDALSVAGDLVRSRWTVCAAGQNSRLRAQAGLDSPAFGSARHRFGFCRHYDLPPWSTFVEVHWSDCGQMYVTPLASQLCLALLTRDSRLRFDDALPHFPNVANRLAGAKPLGRMVGGITPTRRLAAVQRGNVALVGEASGSVDAITGDGLTLAFQQALALAAAMKAGDLRLYQRAHRRILRLPGIMAGLMLSLENHPSFRLRAFRALSADPGLFARFVSIHTGASSPFSFGVGRSVALAWHLLTA